MATPTRMQLVSILKAGGPTPFGTELTEDERKKIINGLVADEIRDVLMRSIRPTWPDTTIITS